MSNPLQSLLQKQNQGGSWQDLAAGYFSNENKSSKRIRNLMIGRVLLGAKEMKMQNNVVKNLQENDKQRTFELANLTQKWDAYKGLIEDDKGFKKDKNYFYTKAENKWTELNPNYDAETKNAGNAATETKLQEIKDLQLKLEQIHNDKITKGNITGKNYMTKETFFKPFEDYYDAQEQEIAAPKNLSLVHNAWDKITRNFRDKDELDSKANKITLAEANRNTFGYLVEPDEIGGTAAIETYRKGKKGFDTTKFIMDNNEAKLNILQMQGISQEQKNYLIRNIGDNEYTANELQAKVVMLSADFDPYINERQIANNSFDKQWQNSGKTIPKPKSEGYQDYILRRTNFTDIQTRQGDEELNTLRSQIFMLKDEQANPKPNQQVINYLETQIQEAGIGKIQIMAMNTAMASMSDANVLSLLKLAAEDSDKSEEELKSEHMQSVYSGILDFADAILTTTMPSKNEEDDDSVSTFR